MPICLSAPESEKVGDVKVTLGSERATSVEAVGTAMASEAVLKAASYAARSTPALAPY
jgi:hypothetical protein